MVQHLDLSQGECPVITLLAALFSCWDGVEKLYWGLGKNGILYFTSNVINILAVFEEKKRERTYTKYLFFISKKSIA